MFVVLLYGRSETSAVQPLLQQQRTLVTTTNPTPPPSASSGDSTPEHKYESKYGSHSPSSPISPLTPVTPFNNNLSFPLLTPTSGQKGGLRGPRSGSISARASISHNLYSLREVEEATSSPSLTEYAPGLARRKTLANIFHPGEVHSANMARRISLPDNAL